MTIKAKPILKNRFWIVEDDSKKLGTISWNDDRYMFSDGSGTCYFNNKKEINSKFPFISWGKYSEKTLKNKDFEVNGFPTTVFPYNAMYDIKRKLPLFTKSDQSKSVYCAGYYIIKFSKRWAKSFCPKLITVERYETKGPYKTELEMKQELRRVNS